MRPADVPRGLKIVRMHEGDVSWKVHCNIFEIFRPINVLWATPRLFWQTFESLASFFISLHGIPLLLCASPLNDAAFCFSSELATRHEDYQQEAATA